MAVVVRHLLVCMAGDDNSPPMATISPQTELCQLALLVPALEPLD